MNNIDLTPDISRSIFGLVESIDDLAEILTRIGFWSLFFLAIFGFLLLYKHFRESPQKSKEIRFDPSDAERLFLKGDIEELFAYCDEHFDEFPNDIWISWYRAIGYFNLGRYDEAKLWFEKVTQISPSFSSEIEPYMNAIENASSDESKH